MQLFSYLIHEYLAVEIHLRGDDEKNHEQHKPKGIAVKNSEERDRSTAAYRATRSRKSPRMHFSYARSRHSRCCSSNFTIQMYQSL